MSTAMTKASNASTRQLGGVGVVMTRVIISALATTSATIAA